MVDKDKEFERLIDDLEKAAAKSAAAHAIEVEHCNARNLALVERGKAEAELSIATARVTNFQWR